MASYKNTKIKEYFTHPQNAGEIENPDAIGQSGSTQCRNLVKLSAKIEKNIIKEVKFKAFGCNYTIAGASYLATLTKGKDLLEATLITEKEIEKELGPFPRDKKRVLKVLIDALQKLITDYVSKSLSKSGTQNIYNPSPRKVAVAMSGGMDSSMAAKILLDEGWDVFGITMKFLPGEFRWENASKTCCSPQDIENARKISIKLKMPHIVVNLEDEFREKVIEPFCLNYIEGKTPNPCIECNKYIKFGALVRIAKKLGASFIATGHYCRIERSNTTDLYEVKKSVDKNKDQSYVFWKIDQEQLSHIKTPLGNLLKQEVKKKAQKIFYPLPPRRESQEICFISAKSYHKLLLDRFKNIKEGKILNTKGETVGIHRGYPFYTIGQRKGLGISHTKPLYVKEIIPDKNIIVVGEEEELFEKKMVVSELNFIAGYPPNNTFKANVKIRYKSKESPATIKIIDKATAVVIFNEPQRAITPGQSAVFYQEDKLIGGGIISKYNESYPKIEKEKI